MTTHPAPTLTAHNKRLLRAILTKNGTYVSADEVERADARVLGYGTVCGHPNEVGALGPDDLLVIDFNSVQLGDTHRAVQEAMASAQRGVRVGVHAYHFPPPLAELLAEPLVVAANTHARLVSKLRRLIAARRTIAPDA